MYDEIRLVLALELFLVNSLLPTVHSIFCPAVSEPSFISQLSFDLYETVPQEKREETSKEEVENITKSIVDITKKTVIELNKQVKTFDAVKDESTRDFVRKSIVDKVKEQHPEMVLSDEAVADVINKAIDTCVQALTDKVIPIPRSVIQPFTDIKQGFTEFDLDTRNMNLHPSGDSLQGTELREGGETVTIDPSTEASPQYDTPENEIAAYIISKDNVDYGTCADLIYSLKASNETDGAVVVQKAQAAMKYCEVVTEWNRENGGKPWEYALIPHTEVRISSTFKYLIGCKKNFDVEQIKAQ